MIEALDCAGLYLFDVNKSLVHFSSTNGHVISSCQSIGALVLIVIRIMKVMLYFYFFHPIFLYMKQMYPLIFINKDSTLFQCDIYQLAKHNHTIYIPWQYIPSHPFHLIHMDI